MATNRSPARDRARVVAHLGDLELERGAPPRRDGRPRRRRGSWPSSRRRSLQAARRAHLGRALGSRRHAPPCHERTRYAPQPGGVNDTLQTAPCRSRARSRRLPGRSPDADHLEPHPARAAPPAAPRRSHMPAKSGTSCSAPRVASRRRRPAAPRSRLRGSSIVGGAAPASAASSRAPRLRRDQRLRRRHAHPAQRIEHHLLPDRPRHRRCRGACPCGSSIITKSTMPRIERAARSRRTTTPNSSVE